MRVRRSGAVAVVGAAIAIAAWLNPSFDLGYRGDTVAIAAPEAAGNVATLLDQVKVVDRINDVPGYERSCKRGDACSFGPAWNDPTDSTGCDTRNRMLARDLRDVVFKDGTRNCKVIAGWLQDPYSGERVDRMDVELDHTVALHHAWNAGAWQWDSRKRQIFANDPMELRALSSSVNQDKSDAALDEWMPPLPEARCPFVIDYLSVMVKYELPITLSERDAAAAACATAPLS
ncbi:HNH endonuclease [Mycobacterium hodleri]|uniref:HNH endonuclease family protein n=1 Tax=Mycolicibacterium hodleri TaxID=49897 RepID=UPI0021F3B65D|nr:HNH endonuclease family protein [Mycolicibacterium hodleri]MCV7131366.1 HNH endonuclease [Mycolicibacterium hodleri]